MADTDTLKPTDKEYLDWVWSTSLEAEKTRQGAATGLSEASWRAGGRATKAYPNKENGDWWPENGRTMLDRWVEFRTGWHDWSVWHIDGVPAIELTLTPTFGGVQVKMGIDRVMVNQEGELIVLDIKTGAYAPHSDLQLAFYAAGLEREYGIRPKYGTYWMARQGITTPLVDLDFYDLSMIDDMVGQFDTARKAGLFIPNLSNCNRCGYTAICKYYHNKQGGTNE